MMALPRILNTNDARQVDARWYGAKPGAGNVATELQAALTAAAGETLWLSPGTYTVNSALTAAAGTRIDGYGATLDFSAAGNISALTVGSGCEVYGLTLTGPSSGTYNDNGRGIVCAGTSNHPAAPTYVTGPVVRDCTISGFAGYGVHMTFCEFADISKNTISDIGYAGVGGLSSRDCVVDDNDITTIGYTGVSDAYGAFIDRSSGASETSVPRSYRCRFSRNRVSNITIVANAQGLDTHGGVDFEFTDNIIRNCNVGIAAVASALAGSYELAPQRVRIVRNAIVGNNSNSGIVVTGASNDGGATLVEYADSCVVNGNVIIDAGAANDTNEGGIRFYGTTNIAVANNVVTRANVNGITSVISNLGMSVSGNVIVDPHASAVEGVCVRVNGNNCTGSVVSNVFRFEDAGVDTLVCDNGFLAAAGRTGCEILVRDNARIGASATKVLIKTNGVAGIVAAQQYEGTADPEGAVFGNVGDVYHRTSGGAGTVLYTKESGAGTNTGWDPKIASTDSRLSDARTPTAHTHGLADITDEGALASLNTVGTSQIDNDAVTYAKMQNVAAASKLLGRGSAAGAGDVEELTLGTNLSMSGTTLNATGGGTPATTVVAETSYGAASAVGVATNYAREDHTHGTPSLGTTGTTACAGNDARLSDARTPTAHTHPLSQITDEGALASLNAITWPTHVNTSPGFADMAPYYDGSGVPQTDKIPGICIDDGAISPAKTSFSPSGPETGKFLKATGAGTVAWDSPPGGSAAPDWFY